MVKWSRWRVPADGSYGIAPGVIYSYPVICEGGDYRVVQGIDVSEFSRGKMDATNDELVGERDAIADLLPKETEAETQLSLASCCIIGNYKRKGGVAPGRLELLMNTQRVWFAFFIVLALTLNFGFFVGEIDNPYHHNPYEFFFALVVSLIADRPQTW